MLEAEETCKGVSQIGIVITGCCSGCFVPKQWCRCVRWIYGLAEPHHLSVSCGEQRRTLLLLRGSPACSQIHTQAYFIAFFQASATALIRASLFWDVSDALKQPVCPICQATSSPRQIVPICSPSTSVA